jgi:hypothetical protein
MWLVLIRDLRAQRGKLPAPKVGYLRVVPGQRAVTPAKVAPPIACWVLPRRDGTAAERQVLGDALGRWSKRESGENGILHHMDNLALLDLLAEESPQAFVLQMLGKTGEPDPWGEKVVPALGAEPPAPEERTVFFAVRGGSSYDRRRVIASLRQDIAADLVEDILIDNQSWDVAD